MLRFTSMRGQRGWLLLIAGALLSGCVERIFTVRTDPPGARVLIDGREVGESPHTETFIYYGTLEVSVRADDYITRTELVELEQPWWQEPIVDFVSEVIWPFTERDEHEVFIRLEPEHFDEADLDAALQRARDLKQRSQESRVAR
jgi:hypothetical protein